MVLDYEFELITDLKTDPKLDNEQVESIARELERLYDLYEKLMAMKPLEFSLSKYTNSDLYNFRSKAIRNGQAAIYFSDEGIAVSE